MQTKTMIWTAAATTAATALAVYYLRRKKTEPAQPAKGRKKSRQPVKTFAKAKA